MMASLFRVIFNPFRVIKALRKRLTLYSLKKNHNLILGKNVVFHGRPLIDTRNNGTIEIHDNVIINSSNKGYHLNLSSPTKLFVDEKGSKISIGEFTRIHGSCLHAWSSITIGKRCLIAGNCQITDSNGHDLSFDNVENRINTKGTSNPIVIEDDVWIGANSIILPGVTIGKGSVVGAGSVVSTRIPPNSIVRGNPAKFIVWKNE